MVNIIDEISFWCNGKQFNQIELSICFLSIGNTYYSLSKVLKKQIYKSVSKFYLFM